MAQRTQEGGQPGLEAATNRPGHSQVTWDQLAQLPEADQLCVLSEQFQCQTKLEPKVPDLGALSGTAYAWQKQMSGEVGHMRPDPQSPLNLSICQ